MNVILYKYSFRFYSSVIEGVVRVLNKTDLLACFLVFWYVGIVPCMMHNIESYTISEQYIVKATALGIISIVENC